MSKSCSVCSTPAGLTLIEVLTALALLSTLLVGTMIAFSRSAEQIRRSQQSLEVLHRVDELLFAWTASGGTAPRSAQGQLPGGGELIWKTHVVETGHRRVLGIDVVRLEVYAGQEAVSRQPLVALDLAVPAAE